MKAIGIICEYHPFHLGHAYQIAVLKEKYPQAVRICVLSGAFVQRGEPAMFSKYDRAAMAVSMGADLVLELPYPWSCAPAQLFARGGTSILYRMGANGICFGTEGDTLPVIEAAAIRINGDDFTACMQKALSSPEAKKKGYPAIRDSVFEALLGGETANILRTPNNALALSYLSESAKLAKRFSKAPLTAIAIARMGAAHDAPISECNGETLSASALRALLKQGKTEKASASMPKPAADILQKAIAEGRMLTSDPSMLVLHKYRTQDPIALSAYAGLGGGMAERICTAVQKATTLDELYSLIAARQYTTAHLRRTVWHGFFETQLTDMQALPPYTTVLAASERGRTYLRSYAKAQKADPKDSITVLSRPAKAKQCSKEVQTAHIRAMQAEAVQAMLFSSPISQAALYAAPHFDTKTQEVSK